ncbi:wat1-related protein [Quercus suber]|uniref:Wat1-related protein n=1 Tax=Quercus suber TaxID=58331 RepID=A0AAW0IJC5_QUESU
MALFFRQEKLKFWSINGQGKIWGLVLSAAGALVLVLWEGPVLLTSRLSNIQATSDGVIGLIMIVVGVLATSFWNIMVKHVTQFYPAELSLSAMMSFFGTIQTAIGIVVTGLSYYVMTWSIKKNGPVFTSAFNPLLVVFSIVGAVSVIFGLYLILWAKANDMEKKEIVADDSV